MDNPFFTFLGKVCDVIFLSVVYILLCIPLFTIGPANTAMYYATVKVIRRERGYLFREFFKSFKMNFKRSAIIGVVLTILFIIIGVDIFASYTSLNGKTTFSSILFGIYIAIALLLTSFSIYVFPVLSRFELNVKQLIKVVFFMSMKHLPSTLAMLIIQVAAIASVIFIPILIFIIPVTSTFLISLLMERIFKKYMPKIEDSEEQTSKDEWYLE
jgi:uncharacterized membrane protein YesL